MLMELWINHLRDSSQITELSLHTDRAIRASEVPSLYNFKNNNTSSESKNANIFKTIYVKQANKELDRLMKKG